MAVSFSKGALNFRELLNKLSHQPDTKLHDFWFLGNAVLTSFSLPLNFKPYAVYNAGVRQKEGSADEYTINFDGFIYSVVFSVAPANLADVVVDAYRV